MAYSFLKYLLVMLGTFLFVGLLFFSTPGVMMRPIHFQTKDGAFQFVAIPEKGRDWKMLESQFKRFKQNNPQYENDKVYRASLKNYLDVRQWCAYKYNPEWQYPYLPWR